MGVGGRFCANNFRGDQLPGISSFRPKVKTQVLKVQNSVDLRIVPNIIK